ncbi:cobalt transporter, partial [Bacillus cereus]
MNYIENNGLYYRHNHGGHHHNGGHNHHGGHNHYDHHHHGGGWGWG